MKLLCFLVVYFGSDLGNVSAIDSRIVGGNVIAIDKIPYRLSLSVDGTFKCGAVITSTKAALTSAQCVNGVSSNSITLRAGSNYKDSLGTVHKVGSTIIHNNYNRNTHDCDIAILKVETPFEFGVSVTKVDLPSVDEIVGVGSTVNISGWGITTIGGTSFSNQLQVITLKIVATTVRSAAHLQINDITDRMICAGFISGGREWCTGDTGGPLVYGKKLIGLASWGSGCGKIGTPGVYTKVSALRPWISTYGGV